ncbi:MAG TPA: hypothetical protein VJQ57_09325 [Acidimicrobiia bacterium]|nr:hypothetical protein [Acidimicrobiia bacterium]
MLTVSKTLDQLTDAALDELARYNEGGFRVVLGAAALADASDTSFELTDGTRANITDVIEFEGELVYITAKTSDPTPVFTCVRGFDGTTAAAHAAGTAGLVNPLFPRRRVQAVIKTALGRMEANGIPLVKQTTVNREADLYHAELPAETREVYQVTFIGEDGHPYHLDKWEFTDVPASVLATGKLLRIPRYVDDEDDLIVTYRAPYRWSTYPSEPVGASTITLPEGAQDVPVLYTIARIVTRREISRQQLDRSEEWNNSQQVVNGISSGLVRMLWQDFYRSIDEAKRLFQAPTYRPYRKARRF